MQIIRERLRKSDNVLDIQTAQETLSVLEVALERFDGKSNEQANVHKLIGEIHERMGNTDRAIERYELALTLNPKIGLKIKLAALQKRMV